MKAVAFHEHGSASVLQYKDIPDPVPARGEVIIDVEYCGVNHLDTDGHRRQEDKATAYLRLRHRRHSA